jgi:hypothetical protein
MTTTLRSLAALCALTLVLSRDAAAQEAQPAAAPAPATAPVARPPIKPLAAADGEKFVADYDITLPDGRILAFKIFTEEGALMGQAEGQPKVPLLYLGDNTFGADFDPTVRLSFVVENGKVVSGTLLQNGGKMNVTRRP